VVVTWLEGYCAEMTGRDALRDSQLYFHGVDKKHDDV
jgi:hypothetical protein